MAKKKKSRRRVKKKSRTRVKKEPCYANFCTPPRAELIPLPPLIWILEAAKKKFEFKFSVSELEKKCLEDAYCKKG